MNKVRDYIEIKDYLHSARLNLDQKLPDFMIYDFNDLNADAEISALGYRQHFFEITLEINKGCCFDVDTFSFPLEGNRVSFISPGRLQSIQIHPNFREEVNGFTLFFSHDFIHTSFNNHHLFNDFHFFRHTQSPVLYLDNASLQEVTDIFQKIHHEYREYGNESREIIKSYINILLHKGKARYTPQMEKPTAHSREAEIAHRFEAICQKEFLTLFSVKEIAAKMGLSARHLSETVKKVTGKKALDILNGYRINHAKSLLTQTDFTPTRIAYELNFENPDYFFTFFKRSTGVTPQQFRQF